MAAGLPEWNSVVLHLTCDGSNGSTTFTDKSNAPIGSITVSGNAQVSTAQSVFGGASAKFDGSGDRISVPSNSNLQLGTGDFTVRFWMRPSNGGGQTSARVLAFGNDGVNGSLFLNRSGTTNPMALNVNVYSSGYINVVSSGATTLANDTWAHIEVSRASGVWRLFVNGVLTHTVTYTSSGNNLTADKLFVGNSSANTSSFDGYIDDIQVLKGVALHDASFSLPGAANAIGYIIEGSSGLDATATGTGQFYIAAAISGDIALQDLTCAGTGEVLNYYAPLPADTVTATDSLAAVREAAPLADTVAVTDAASAAHAAIALPLADTVAATDALAALVSAALADSVAVTDALLAEVSVDALADTVTASDALGVTVSHVAAPLADSVVVTDAISEGRTADAIEDAVAATDAVSGQLALAAVGLADAVALTDSLGGTLGLTALFEDAVTASDALGVSSLALVAAPLLDTVRVTDALVLTDQRLVVTNAETGAVSTYEFPVAVTGLAEYRGTLYVAAADGLYALDAAQDETGAVVWTLATGFANLGTELLKRVPDMNIQGRTDGDLTVAVTVDRTGEKLEYTYRLPPLTRESYRDGVCKVGKGLQSVYWGLALRGQGPAEIDQLRPRVEPLSRRR